MKFIVNNLKFKKMTTLFHYQSQMSFGMGAYTLKIVKKGGKICAYRGIPQTGPSLFATINATEELVASISDLDDSFRENANYLESEVIKPYLGWSFKK